MNEQLQQAISLQTDKGDAAIIMGNDRPSRYVVVCEHAGLCLPVGVGNLGLSTAELNSHIAWDPGASAVAQKLAELLDGPAILQRYSRLVYDCNRPPSSLDAMRDLSENTQISGNRNLSEFEKHWRTQNIYNSFHRAVSQQLQARKAAILITIHSFTPIYKGIPRDVDVGILHDTDTRLADAMLKTASFAKGVLVKRNEPYGPKDGVTHTLQLHGIKHQIPNVMIEIKNNLIADQKSQLQYASILAQSIKNATELMLSASEPIIQGD